MAKINQQELAKRLNLSQTTVSRSLSNHPAINAETKAQVLEAAAKLGYRQRIKRTSAKARENQQQIFGVLISMPKRYSNTGPSETFQDVLRGIADKSSLHDSILDVVYYDPVNDNPGQLMRRIRSAHWKGVILIHPIDTSLAYEIAHQAACVSIVENYSHDLIDSVDVDQTDGIITLIGKLHQLGHRKIAFMTWVYDVPTPWVMNRFSSYVQGLFMHNLKFDLGRVINILPSERMDPSRCADRVKELIDQGITAVVCPADHQAYQLMQDLSESGIRVPHDISITGFDGVYPPPQVPQLDTVKVPYEELGRSAVHQLIRRMEQPTSPRRHILVDGEVINGATIRDLYS